MFGLPGAGLPPEDLDGKKRIRKPSRVARESLDGPGSSEAVKKCKRQIDPSHNTSTAGHGALFAAKPGVKDVSGSSGKGPLVAKSNSSSSPLPNSSADFKSALGVLPARAVRYPFCPHHPHLLCKANVSGKNNQNNGKVFFRCVNNGSLQSCNFFVWEDGILDNPELKWEMNGGNAAAPVLQPVLPTEIDYVSTARSTRTPSRN